MIASLGETLVALLDGDAPGSGALRAIDRRLAGLYLDGIAAGSLPRDTSDRLRRAAAREAMDAAVMERELSFVLSTLAEDGLVPVVLKGHALAVEVWPRPSLRPPGDIDLLLEPHGVEAAARRLEREGFRRAPTEPAGALRSPPTGIELLPIAPRRVGVDLHARLFRSVGRRIEPAALLARARKSELLGAPVRALDDADRLHFLFVHAAKHGVRELKWLLDLVAVAARSSESVWREAARRAAEARTERPFHAAARLAAMASAPVPTEILNGMAPPIRWRPILDRLFTLDAAIAGRAPGRGTRYALEIALEPSLAARVRMAVGVLERRLVAGCLEPLSRR